MSPGYSHKENAVRFERCLDGRAALHAREVIEATSPRAELVLDFSQVRDLDYLALATVVVAIARRRGRPVALRGLCDQHLRAQRYLGIDVDQLARREGAAPTIPGTVPVDPRSRARARQLGDAPLAGTARQGDGTMTVRAVERPGLRGTVGSALTTHMQ